MFTQKHDGKWFRFVCACKIGVNLVVRGLFTQKHDGKWFRFLCACKIWVNLVVKRLFTQKHEGKRIRKKKKKVFKTGVSGLFTQKHEGKGVRGCLHRDMKGDGSWVVYTET